MKVNGKIIDLNSKITLKEFLQMQGYDLTKIAVERNGQIVPRNTFDQVYLKDQDHMEIVHFVGGG